MTHYTPLTPELLCSNIQISLAFYTEILGFTIDYQRPEDGFVMLERQGARLMLEQIDPNSTTTWIAGPLEHPFGRGMNLQIETINVDELYSKVQNAKATIFLPIKDSWYRANDVYLGCREFIVQDPDGYLLRFQEFLGGRPLGS